MVSILNKEATTVANKLKTWKNKILFKYYTWLEDLVYEYVGVVGSR